MRLQRWAPGAAGDTSGRFLPAARGLRAPVAKNQADVEKARSRAAGDTGSASRGTRSNAKGRQHPPVDNAKGFDKTRIYSASRRFGETLDLFKTALWQGGFSQMTAPGVWCQAGPQSLTYDRGRIIADSDCFVSSAHGDVAAVRGHWRLGASQDGRHTCWLADQASNTSRTIFFSAACPSRKAISARV